MALTSGAVITSFAGCLGEDPDFEEGNTDSNGDDGGDNGGSEPSVQDDVEILEHELIRSDEGTAAEQVSVEGRAENTSEESFSYVEVRARFYNENGDLLESFLDNINDFESGQTWAFEIMYPAVGEDAREVADYDIAVGTSF